MSGKAEVLVYGANGYTGQLICEQLKKLNQDFIVAGRNETKTKQIAEQFKVPFKVFSLDDPQAVVAALEPAIVVLHCAGPYSATSKPMLDGCIKAKTHYLDITGEYSVIEAVAARDEEIRAAGILAMPSTGMDVVPSDCIAAHVAGRLPSANDLKIYIRTNGSLSPGTTKTLLEALGEGNRIRRDGVIKAVPFGEPISEITFPDGKPLTLVSFPWGDVSSAYHTTNIPNIAVFMASVPAGAAKAINWLSPLFNNSYVRRGLQALAGRLIKGETAEQRDNAFSEFIAVATDAESNQVKSYLKIINGYSFTALSAVDIAQRVIKGDFKPGFFTPAGLYGADLVLDIPGSVREDI